ncbi:MAG: hypothetical protein KDC54_09130, partial [Lewinella sp.]|nr:hypothetical protein [Lewinella sp.]
MAKAAATPSPSSRYRFFLWVVGFLALAQWLVGLDYITVWPGDEARLLWDARTGEGGFHLPVLLLGLLPVDWPYWLLAYRLPGMLLTVLCLWAWVRWGSPLFSRKTVVLGLLAAAAHLFIPFLLKTATLSVWSFGPLLLSWTALLQWIKQPSDRWRWRASLLGTLAILTGGLPAFLSLLIFYLSYAYWYARRFSGISVGRVIRPLIIPFVVGVAFLVLDILTGNLAWPAFY